MNNNSLQLTQRFDAPKCRPFHGWAGVITDWPEKAAPVVDFGNWESHPNGGGTVTFDCEPFKLCMFGANSKEMQSRDKFKYFAFAGLGIEGKLVLQRLPVDADARSIFAAGGWKPPLIDQIVSSVNRACNLELGEIEDEIRALKSRCADGFGMNLGCSLNEQRFLDILASWPMLAPLNTAFLFLLENQTRLFEKRRASSADARRINLEIVLAEMRVTNAEITPLSVASRMLGMPLTADAAIPPKVKDKAKRLEKEFPAQFLVESEM